ncbi:DUF7344 domain-containing protein [Halocatena marina]|uniref:DUF7344 domain-containing protein n=1 Tax=Halocatena marina TaxID=2934937 RepID=A0ABD5YLL7_9EURY|nr:hypothetical protein [Halocatena marina]
MAGGTNTGSEYADVVYAILADRERRVILQGLSAHGMSETVSELVQRTQSDGTSGRDDQAFRIRLHHQHLPKMTDEGIVEYDHDDGSITLTSKGQQVEAVRRRTAKLLESE